MAELKKPEPKQLDAEVAKKYNCNPSYLYGGNMVWDKQSKHSVANKPVHELTVEEVDVLVAAGAAKGVFTLKKPADKPATAKP